MATTPNPPGNSTSTRKTLKDQVNAANQILESLETNGIMPQELAQAMQEIQKLERMTRRARAKLTAAIQNALLQGKLEV